VKSDNWGLRLGVAGINYCRSLSTSINCPVREDVFLTVQFEDYSKLRSPCSVSIPFTKMAVFCSADIVDEVDVGHLWWPKYTQTGESKDNRSQKWQFWTRQLRTGRLRNRLLELNCYENVDLNLTVKKTTSRSGRLMLVGIKVELLFLHRSWYQLGSLQSQRLYSSTSSYTIHILSLMRNIQLQVVYRLEKSLFPARHLDW